MLSYLRQSLAKFHLTLSVKLVVHLLKGMIPIQLISAVYDHCLTVLHELAVTALHLAHQQRESFDNFKANFNLSNH